MLVINKLGLHSSISMQICLDWLDKSSGEWVCSHSVRENDFLSTRVQI